MLRFNYPCNCEICGTELFATSNQWGSIEREWRGEGAWVCANVTDCSAQVKKMRKELEELKKQKVTA